MLQARAAPLRACASRGRSSACRASSVEPRRSRPRPCLLPCAQNGIPGESPRQRQAAAKRHTQRCLKHTSARVGQHTAIAADSGVGESGEGLVRLGRLVLARPSSLASLPRVPTTSQWSSHGRELRQGAAVQSGRLRESVGARMLQYGTDARKTSAGRLTVDAFEAVEGGRPPRRSTARGQRTRSEASAHVGSNNARR